MDADQLAVELVIETASGILTGRFGPREAVTILATQAPHARSRARVLATRDPGWSAGRAELLGAISAELASRLDGNPQARDLREVLSELDRIGRALSAPG